MLTEQLGLPIPALPLLLLAGAQAVGHPAYGAYALAAAVLACSISNLAWFWAGRRFGFRVLKLLCRVSLSVDTCVRQTENVFERRGAAALVIAKFVPGLTVAAPPLAAALGFSLRSFLIYNGAGAILYCGTALALGAVFHNQIDWLLEQIENFGGRALVAVAVLLLLYLAWRWWDRARFLKSLHSARIGVDELHRMMSTGEHPIVLDVRSRAHRGVDGRRIPGARGVDLDNLEATLAQIPRDRDVVVYCACPNEVSAVRVAMQLRERGIHRVRPLAGGIDAWVSAGLNVESFPAE